MGNIVRWIALGVLGIGVTLALQACSSGGGYWDPLPYYTPPVHLPPGTDPPPQPVTTPYPALPTAAAWPQASGTQRGDSLSSVQGPLNPQTTRLRFPGYLYGHAVLCADGLWRVVAGRTLVAVEVNGTLNSITPLPDSIQPDSSLAVSPDGQQLYLSGSSALHALSLQGAVAWSSTTTLGRIRAPHVAVSGQIIVLVEVDSLGLVALQAYNPGGGLAWSCEPGMPFASATFGPDDTAYITGLSGTGLGTHTVMAIGNGNVLWSRQTMYLFNNHALLGLDGRIYFMTENLPTSINTPHTFIESFSPQGVPAPPLAVSNDLYWNNGTPVAADGTLYFSDAIAGGIRAYSASGQPKWHTPGAPGMYSLYARPEGGVLAFDVSSNPGRVARLDANGTLLWQNDANLGLDDPQFLPGGKVLFADNGGLTQLRNDGTIDFRFSLPSSPTSNIAAAADGTAYALCGSQLVKFDSSGQPAHYTDVGGTFGSVQLASNGSLVLAGYGGFNVLSAQGQTVTGVNVPTDGGSLDCLLGADDTVYISGVNRQQVAAFTLAGQRKWTYTDDEYLLSRPALDEQGNLYVISFRQPAESLDPHLDLLQALTPAVPGGSAATAYWLVSLNRAGAVRFRLQLPAAPSSPFSWQYTVSSPLVGPDGRIYLSFGDGTIRSYDAAGSGTPTEFRPEHGALLLGAFPDGRLLVRLYGPEPTPGLYSSSGALALLDTLGAVVWRHEIGTAAVLDHFTDAAGRSYFVTYGGDSGSEAGTFLLGLGPDGQQLFQQSLTSTTGLHGYPGPLVQAVPTGTHNVLVPLEDELLRLSD